MLLVTKSFMNILCFNRDV